MDYSKLSDDELLKLAKQKNITVPQGDLNKMSDRELIDYAANKGVKVPDPENKIPWVKPEPGLESGSPLPGIGLQHHLKPGDDVKLAALTGAGLLGASAVAPAAAGSSALVPLGEEVAEAAPGLMSRAGSAISRGKEMASALKNNSPQIAGLTYLLREGYRGAKGLLFGNDH